MPWSKIYPNYISKTCGKYNVNVQMQGLGGFSFIFLQRNKYLLSCCLFIYLFISCKAELNFVPGKQEIVVHTWLLKSYYFICSLKHKIKVTKSSLSRAVLLSLSTALLNLHQTLFKGLHFISAFPRLLLEFIVNTDQLVQKVPCF